jgi:hypothetical protein
MLSLCYRKNCFEYSIQSKQIAIGSNRKRGRPRLTAPALEYQENEYVYSDTDSETEETKKASKTTKKRKANETNVESDYDIFANDDIEESRTTRSSKRSKTDSSKPSTSKSSSTKSSSSKSSSTKSSSSKSSSTKSIAKKSKKN